VTDRTARTIILGLGNPILRDDAVGVKVARALRAYLAGRPDVDVQEASIGGLKLLDQLTGYTRAIIVDSIRTEGGTPGEIHRLSPDELGHTQHLSSPHEINFMGAMKVAADHDLAIPSDITVIAIEIKDNMTFGEDMTPEVEAAIPRAVGEVLKEVGTVG
jgi:hydrogenase maturation protease